MRRLSLALLTLSITAFGLNAQELNCQVSVVASPGIQTATTHLEIFKEMEQSIFEFMNSRAWTKDVYEIDERIDCSMLFTITKIVSNELFEAELTVQSSRPVYNTTYNTSLFSYKDNDVNIRYARNTPLLFTEGQYQSELTSILAFYAYMFLGMDYDTFSLEGGTEHYDNARKVVQAAQSTQGSGWVSDKGRKNNRYWLVENILHKSFANLRKCYYEYHRLGIDKLHDTPEEARKNASKAITYLQLVHNVSPSSVNMFAFLGGKRSELVNMFQEADTRTKQQVVNVLKRVDPSNSSEYQKILG